MRVNLACVSKWIKFEAQQLKTIGGFSIESPTLATKILRIKNPKILPKKTTFFLLIKPHSKPKVVK
jgi:hypothetical protein